MSRPPDEIRKPDKLSRARARFEDLAAKYRVHWPDVSSPAARVILASAYEFVPAQVRKCFEAGGPYELPANLHEYAIALREKLKNSGLAVLLAGGQSMLPDIYPQLPWFLRPLEEYYRPRNYQRLLWHVIQYLDWYLSPGSRESISRTAKGIGWRLLYGFVILPLYIWFLISNHGSTAATIIYMLPPLPSFLATIFRYPSGLFTFRLMTFNDHLDAFKINAVELYRYLRLEYSDLSAEGIDPLAEKQNSEAVRPVYNPSNELNPPAYHGLPRPAADSSGAPAGPGSQS